MPIDYRYFRRSPLLVNQKDLEWVKVKVSANREELLYAAAPHLLNLKMFDAVVVFTTLCKFKNDYVFLHILWHKDCDHKAHVILFNPLC